MRNTDIIIKPSRRYIALLVAKMVIIFYAILSLSLSLSPFIKIVLFCITGCYGIYIIWAYGFLRSQNSILGVRLLSNGTWMLFTKEKVIAGEIGNDSLVTARLIILRFLVPGSWWKRSVVLFSDSLKPTTYRELFMYIHFGR